MIPFIICLLVYGLSAYKVWDYMGKAHSKWGIWGNLDTGAPELFLTFYPLLNTIAALLCIFVEPPIESEAKKFNYNKFFRVKK